MAENKGLGSDYHTWDTATANSRVGSQTLGEPQHSAHSLHFHSGTDTQGWVSLSGHAMIKSRFMVYYYACRV